MKVVVHLDRWSPAACADALHLFEREHAVGCYALVPNAQFLLEFLVNLVSAAQHATDIGADLHVEFARWLEAEHGIVGRHVRTSSAVMPIRCATSAITASDRYPISSCAYSSIGTSAERRSRYFSYQRIKAGRQPGREDASFVSARHTASTPAPMLLPPYPSLPRVGLRNRPASVSSSFRSVRRRAATSRARLAASNRATHPRDAL